MNEKSDLKLIAVRGLPGSGKSEFAKYLGLNFFEADQYFENFIDISRNLLTKNGYLVFGTRNRLFNLFSLNKFSVSELKKRTYRNFFEESVHLTHLNFKNMG